MNCFFSAFADKTLAFEFNHLIQLITFSSSINVVCEFNNNYEKFIHLVDGANPSGSTACYDAID